MYSHGRIAGPDFAVLAHPLRMRIVEVCTEYGGLSPTEIRDRKLCAGVKTLEGKSGEQQLSTIGYHCRKLAEAEVLTDHAEKARGFTKHIYSANVEAIFLDEDWTALDKEERESLTMNAYQRFLTAVQMSMKLGLFDERTDRVLGWGPLTMDEKGWKEVTDLMVDTFMTVEGPIREAAERRLMEPGATPLRLTYGVFAFESPMPEDLVALQ
jgi:hypothetical protein